MMKEVKILIMIRKNPLVETVVGVYSNDKILADVKENCEAKHPEAKFQVVTFALNIPNR